VLRVIPAFPGLLVLVKVFVPVPFVAVTVSYPAVPKVTFKLEVVPVSVGVYERVKVPLPRSELAFTNPPSAALVPYSIT
jgi:hypothetical protein